MRFRIIIHQIESFRLYGDFMVVGFSCCFYIFALCILSWEGKATEIYSFSGLKLFDMD